MTGSLILLHVLYIRVYRVCWYIGVWTVRLWVYSRIYCRMTRLVDDRTWFVYVCVYMLAGTFVGMYVCIVCICFRFLGVLWWFWIVSCFRGWPNIVLCRHYGYTIPYIYSYMRTPYTPTPNYPPPPRSSGTSTSLTSRSRRSCPHSSSSIPWSMLLRYNIYITHLYVMYILYTTYYDHLSSILTY